MAAFTIELFDEFLDFILVQFVVQLAIVAIADRLEPALEFQACFLLDDGNFILSEI